MSQHAQAQVHPEFCKARCTLWIKGKGCEADRWAWMAEPIRPKGQCARETEEIEKAQPGAVRRKQ